MPKFPADAPKTKVVRALEILGFSLIREGNHIDYGLPFGKESGEAGTLDKGAGQHDPCSPAQVRIIIHQVAGIK